MDAADVLFALARAALGASAAILLIAAIRRPLRQRLGAPVAYTLWLLLPAMTAAAAIGRPVPALAMDATLLWSASAAMATSTTRLDDGGGWASDVLLLSLWGLGALAMLAIGVLRYRRWHRAIGPLRTDADGIAWAGPHASLPALAGWPRPRLVLPADFDARFTPVERALVIAHERRHAARGDLQAQAAFEVLRVLLWFNPLLHWAASRFRQDQELACDAEVLALHRDAAGDYARALLRATSFPLPPLATSWGSVHPLKERLAMLQHSPRSLLARRAGLGLVGLTTLLAAALAWASLPRGASVPDGQLRQTWTLQIDDGPKQGPFLLVDAPGVPVEIRFDHAGQSWTLRSAATVLVGDGTFDVRAQVLRGDTEVSSPRMVIGKDGGSIAIGQQVSVDSTSGDLDVSKGIVATVHVEAGEGVAMAGAVPHYPADAADAGVEGTVILRVKVSAEGRATGMRVERSSGHASLDAAAMARVRDWRFTPRMKDGAPVAGEVLVPVEFRAEARPPAGE